MSNTQGYLEVNIKDEKLQKAAQQGMDEFVDTFVQAIEEVVDGPLTLEIMQRLTLDQITLLAWHYLHQEVMDGGFIQMIYNGYGAFIFKNPFAVAMRQWGVNGLYTLIKHAKKYYLHYQEQIEVEMTDEEFMALYEQMPEFDEFDDEFVVNEEKWTSMIAAYIDDHIDNFAHIVY